VLDARGTNIPHIHPGPYSKGSPRDVNKGILFLRNRLVPPPSDWRQQGDFVLILHKRLDAFLVDVFLCYRVLLPPPLACLLYVVIVLVLLLSVHQLIVVLYLDPMRLVEKRGLTGCFLS
jgi:hypothetical protein